MSSRPQPQGVAQATDAPVRAERTVERRELKPACVQLARQLARRVEAARVRTPVRRDAQTGVQADPDLVPQRVPARHVSPDQSHAPHRAIPTTPLRLSVHGRTFGVVIRWPW